MCVWYFGLILTKFALSQRVETATSRLTNHRGFRLRTGRNRRQEVVRQAERVSQAFCMEELERERGVRWLLLYHFSGHSGSYPDI